jgi:hypothetical protein
MITECSLQSKCYIDTRRDVGVKVIERVNFAYLHPASTYSAAGFGFEGLGI